MYDMFLINENVTNNFQSISLNIVTIAAIICGIFVIVSKNPIVSVLYLIGFFMSVAIFLILQWLNFLGLAYLLVYVGAVSILFLFILMLINVRISEIISSTSNSIPLGIAIGTILYVVISKALPNNLNQGGLLNFDLILPSQNLVSKLEKITNVSLLGPASQNDSNITCNNVMSSNWDGMLTDFSHISVIGNVLYSVYSLWLLLTSLILLLAMVGTIVITIKK